ncbi:branched-chain-amino-acid aminotransferase 3, chloroplastic-like isoform X2 [Amborella trichopoda]|uniref:branched-chain-amino-acid aminotransferase 3, chloroplastic-like isoform X2 n=1 Tax=Amborella trichopoda TaxID=13333 RepID=UPI0009BE9C5F|nr:branched-chain-amino-acid aminotransferase 3, chloroplastic-like isoform X2 [Amborella trichopoda]|eukprot:XP_020529974.1 branched-chain-amino-acid aminotransferase 3, chloroplastic-like isoform X2 [Amborella trichopoda]
MEKKISTLMPRLLRKQRKPCITSTFFYGEEEEEEEALAQAWRSRPSGSPGSLSRPINRRSIEVLNMENLALTRTSSNAGLHGLPTFWSSRRWFSSAKSITNPSFCSSSPKPNYNSCSMSSSVIDASLTRCKAFAVDACRMQPKAVGESRCGDAARYGLDVGASRQCGGVARYGLDGLFEGLKAYRKKDGDVVLFRPEENGLRMQRGAERMCMPSPSVEQFVDAVKETVWANRRWVPPFGKGSLYIRPLLFGSGPILGLAPAPEYTFLVYVSPVGNYFKEGLAPISLLVDTEFHRATRGGTGGVKTIGNYAAVLKAQARAKSEKYTEVLYLDSIHKKYLEEVSAANIFLVKGKTILTPPIKGTILPGITRLSIIDVAQNEGYKVEERPIPVEELFEADEVFCTGCAVVVSPVGSITYERKKMQYGNGGVGKVSQQLYSALTGIQWGLMEDNFGWVVAVEK